MKTALNHVHSQHKPHGKEMLEHCNVQWVYHTKTEYWVVEENYSTFSGDQSRVPEHLETIKELNHQGVNTGCFEKPTNQLAITPFMVTFQWGNITDGKEGKELMELVSIPRNRKEGDNNLPELKLLNKGYFESIEPTMRNFNPIALQWINTPKGWVIFVWIIESQLLMMMAGSDNPVNMPFSYTMKEETEDRYEEVAERLVCFAVQVFSGGEDAPINVNFSPEQATSLDHLNATLPIPTSQQQPGMSSCDAYHAVLKSLLFSIHPNINTLMHKYPISLFLICLNTQDRMCNFKHPRSIATSCSTLLHIMQLAAVREIRILQDPDAHVDAALKSVYLKCGSTP
jgi:hypothetical protein